MRLLRRPVRSVGVRRLPPRKAHRRKPTGARLVGPEPLESRCLLSVAQDLGGDLLGTPPALPEAAAAQIATVPVREATGVGPAGATDVAAPETFDGGYLSVKGIYQRLHEIVAAYPTITELRDYGDSYSKTVGGVTTPDGQRLAGYDLLALKITNQAIAGPKPVFFLMAGIHAREIATPEIALRFVDWLTQNYGRDGDATWLVDQHEIWVVPTANPDGHWYVEAGTQAPYNDSPWMWRKNGHSYGSAAWPPSVFNQYGVDLNRNFAFHWGTQGVEWDPSSQTYPGPAAASEPETRAMQNLLSSVFPDQRGSQISDPAPDTTTGMFVSLHQYGELVLWPWWDTESPAPNGAGLQAIGRKLATYNKYTAGQGATTLYFASGGVEDWTYGTLGVPSYTFEMGQEFMPPYATIDSTLWAENRGALIYAAKIAGTPYLTALGPDANLVTVGDAGTGYLVTASIDDRANGGQAIAAATYYVDTPPWRSGAVPHTLAAVDGRFDSPVESVAASVPLDGLASGLHVVYVGGQDAAGHEGPWSAGLLRVKSTGAWQNTSQPFDVDGNGQVAALDVLIIINSLNLQGSRPLFAPVPGSGTPPPFWDVTGDDWLTPADVLGVINYINVTASVAVAAAEGESTAGSGILPSAARAADAAAKFAIVPVDRLMATWADSAPQRATAEAASRVWKARRRPDEWEDLLTAIAEGWKD